MMGEMVFDAVRHSHSRLTSYRALASPAYISLKHADPILTAFELSHVLDKLMGMEKEYKNEYNKLSNQCKNYAVELLDLCRSTDEIGAILNGGDVSDDVNAVPSLTRVKLAIKYGQKRFIAHATCQQQLTSLWYSGVERIRHHRSFIMVLTVMVSFLLLPLASIVYLVAPNSKPSHSFEQIGRMMQTPYVKFLTHSGAYIFFLCLVFTATSRQGSGSPWLDIACKGIVKSLPDSVVYILILIFVIGMLLHESHQMWEDGPKEYIYDWWNWMDSTLIALYLAYYASPDTRLLQGQTTLCVTLYAYKYCATFNNVGERKDELCPVESLLLSCRSLRCTVDHELNNWTRCGSVDRCVDIDHLYAPRSRGEAVDMLSDINQLSDVFFALASLLSFARLAHLLPASEQLGPLLVSFGRMLHNVLQFSIIFLVVFVAFMCGLTSLYRVHQCENVHFTRLNHTVNHLFVARLDQTVNSLFWATFGMGDTKAAVIDKRYLGSRKDLISTHSTHHALTEVVGYGLFWAYITAVVLVMLNMLIAMMSNSFQEIYVGHSLDDSDVEWKFARAKLWIDFFEPGFTLPAPFNLLPNPQYLLHLLGWLRRRVLGCCPQKSATFQMTDIRRQNDTGDGPRNNQGQEYNVMITSFVLLSMSSYTITPKVLAAAQRDIEIARELSIKFSHMVTSRLPHPKRSNSWLSWRYIS
ncbi:hypothetical protein NP493_1128g00031 [Ridgeia piscesae]|uniref:Transient receptor ion channel domain-containing protein n=1 Tax=Ridgeia piscesae TaxID=27915 RepID=A0AAD9NJJ9_RIDPI|nr:hypothetical protein NP493_1128g00031 [Ridgeia piscesae]